MTRRVHTLTLKRMLLGAVGLTFAIAAGGVRFGGGAGTGACRDRIAMAFSTGEAAARVGDTVEWVNNDVVDHTATDKAAAWDVSMAAGKRASVVMKKAGTFAYYCRYHPNMVARLVVTAQATK